MSLDGFRRVADDEGVNDLDGRAVAPPDDLRQMIRHHAAMLRIGIERIGIVAQNGDWRLRAAD